MSFFSVPSRLAVLLALGLFVISVQAVAEHAPAEPNLAQQNAPIPMVSDPILQMYEQLQIMDRRLRTRLALIAEGRLADGSALQTSAREVEQLRRHLNTMEHRLQSWEQGASAPGGLTVPKLIEKARALRPWVDNLERAIEDREAAVAGLASHRRALRVEWPGMTLDAQQAKTTPVNDECADAIPVSEGTYFGDTTTATADGMGCYEGSPDVWFAYTASETTEIIADTFGSGFDTVLSVYSDCPGTFENEIGCNDDTMGLQSVVSFQAQAGTRYLIRVAGCCGSGGNTGAFTLNIAPGGSVGGTVTDATTGEPVSDIDLVARNAQDFFVGSASTGPEGKYEIAGLSPGIYFVYARNYGDYLPQIYDGIPCGYLFCDALSGTPIVITPGATRDGIDFALHKGGAITGRVTDRVTGDSVQNFNVRVEIWNSAGQRIDSDSVDSSGGFHVSGLSAGTYFAVARSSGYLDELYDDLPCSGSLDEDCDPTAGTPIEVSFGTTTLGVDFALERLGSISGVVSDSVSGFPISTANIFVRDPDGNAVGSGGVDQAGTYLVGGLAPGNYFVFVRDFRYFDELYDDLPCEPECDLGAGTPVEVSLNSTTHGIDFVLERLGAISGVVSHQATGDPIDFGDVRIWNGAGEEVDHVRTSSAGAYLVEGLPAGSYTATAYEYDYRRELYDDIPCERCDVTLGVPIEVDLKEITVGIDFALDRLSGISGRVTHAVTGEPLRLVDIEIYDANGDYVNEWTTNIAGEYQSRSLPPGDYFAVATSYRYFDELYDGRPCEGGCDPTTGTAIATSLDAVTPGIDFVLDRMGAITGYVQSITGEPLRNVYVRAYDASGSSIGSDYTSSVGEYLIEGLSPGPYFVVARASDEYLDEVYEDLPCGVDCDPTVGTPVMTDLNRVTTGIHFTLDRSGEISGYMRHAGQTLDSGRVRIYNDSGELEGSGFVDYDGSYQVSGLPDGNYFAVAEHDELNDELYENLPCEGGCDPTTGTPIPVSVNTTSRIDFDLGDCSPTATSLCLTGDRFRVEAIWQDQSNTSGSGFAERLTADAGTFWFFNAGNIELVVKVLDVCEQENRFWVFAAGLTDVGVALRVTDELAGEAITYFNPRGTPYRTVLDTQAFATCDAGRSAGSSARESLRTPPGTLPVAEKGDCLPSDTSLCLGGGRFQAEATWSAPNGDGGTAGAVSLADETGYFYFGGPDNVEVLVKVLDACDLASNKFWVFGAGLTNFEVTLTVTDTVSDVTRVYTNEQGNNFEAITDTGAFDTCDAR